MGFRKLGEPFASVGNPIGKSGKQGFQWLQFATFEAGFVTPYPTGFDVASGVVANLSVTAAAAQRGDYGLQVAVGAGGEAYGRLNQMSTLNMATIDYLFDFNSIVMANGNLFEILRVVDDGLGVGFRLELYYTLANGYQIRGNLINDGGGNNFGLSSQISDLPHHARTYIHFSDGPGINNGYAHFYIDGELEFVINNIDNDTRNFDQLYIGAVFGVDAGTNGNLFYDNIAVVNGRAG